MTVQTDFEASVERVREQLLHRGITAARGASAQTIGHLTGKYLARPKAESHGATSGARPWREIVANMNALADDPGSAGNVPEASEANLAQQLGKPEPWGKVLRTLGIAKKRARA